MKFLRYWLPVTIWMGLIFYFSGKERVAVADNYIVNFIFFKSLHIIEYSILYLLNYRAVLKTFLTRSGWNAVYWAIIISILYAAGDELHQIFVPTREGRVRDVIIDAFGVVFSWYAIKYLLPKAPKRLRVWAKSWEII